MAYCVYHTPTCGELSSGRDHNATRNLVFLLLGFLKLLGIFTILDIQLATHIPYPVIVQAKRPGHALKIDRCIGRKANTRKHKVFHTARQAQPGGSI